MIALLDGLHYLRCRMKDTFAKSEAIPREHGCGWARPPAVSRVSSQCLGLNSVEIACMCKMSRTCRESQRSKYGKAGQHKSPKVQQSFATFHTPCDQRIARV